MSASLREIGGELMIVSQFTLSAVTHKKVINLAFIERQAQKKLIIFMTY